LEERQLKTTLSVIIATIVPFGFVVLAIAILRHMLVKRRQERGERLQTPSGPTHGDRTGYRLLSL
jgi:uncharacterized membrane protein YidH (DUF202 family)